MKILVVGDSPLAKTGFGRVNAYAVAAFLEREWEVASVTGLSHKSPTTDLPITFFVPEEGDSMGLLKAMEVFRDKLFEPDVVYMTGDPGSISAMAQVIPENQPFFAYVPIEGEPIVNIHWQKVLRHIDWMTCSKYGADIAKTNLGRDIPFVYHGVDPEAFSPLSEEERPMYRSRLDWDGKFVVSCVAQNVRRKQLTRLIEAIAVLKYQYKQNDVILYLHTVPFQNHWLEGWNLPEVAQAFGVESEVVFNPLMSGFGRAVPEKGDLDIPGLRELIGASDLFVLPSQVEGFGLPIAEAMACSVPVVVTKYAAGWEVARLGGGVGLPVADWEIHKSGTRYANIDPQVIAKTILDLKRDPRRLARMRAQGLEAVKQFDWTAFEELLCAKIEDVGTRTTGQHIENEENQGRSEAGEKAGSD